MCLCLCLCLRLRLRLCLRLRLRLCLFPVQSQKPLLIDGVDGQLGLFSSLHNISREHGSGAQERKRAIIARLLVAAKGVRVYILYIPQSCHVPKPVNLKASALPSTSSLEH